MSHSILRFLGIKALMQFLFVFIFSAFFTSAVELEHFEQKENHDIKEFSNKTVVFITGASNGIGLAVEERLAKEGFIVIATARSPEIAPNY